MSVPPDDEDREAILARRNRFIALALVGLAGASTAGACGGETTGDRDASVEDASNDAGTSKDAADSATDGGGFEAGPQPCLSMPAQDAGPLPCLRRVPAGGDD